jgi:hypothetical protein
MYNLKYIFICVFAFLFVQVFIVPAFLEAEGCGKYTKVCCDGEVYYVTNLNDSVREARAMWPVSHTLRFYLQFPEPLNCSE